MGVFSWVTNDTGESIPNNGSNRETFTVTMMDDKGNTWTESNYDGYGIFGGKDFYVLLAEMNDVEADTEDELRDKGIDLYFAEAEDTKFPNLVQYPTVWTYRNEAPESCPDQGMFYPQDEDEDDY